jgi:2-acylglycerol O-acyltransferase 2
LFISVGKPISVIKNENPSQQEVDELHQKFINELTVLFEEHKHNYLDNADGVHLIFED